MIPPFDFQTVFIEPWQVDFYGTLQVVLMGFFVASACGLLGTFLILRKLALMGDAISHSLLPGIALAFLLTASRATVPMFLGAVAAGIVTVLAVEFIHQQSRVKADAAMGIVFSSLFALGVIIITGWADHVDLDADCVLYGELNFIPLYEPFVLGGIDFGPVPLVRMGVILLGLIALLLIFYNQLLVTTFDPGLALSLGIRPQRWHYGLMVALSLAVVASFEAVGSIIVIAMLILPGATAMLLSARLPVVLGLTMLISALTALGGFHLDVWLAGSSAGGMTTVALALFLVVWAGHVAWRRWQHRATLSTSPAPAESDLSHTRPVRVSS